MSEQLLSDFLDDPERYELHEGSPFDEWDRREFFRIVGAGVIVALLCDRVGAQPPAGRGQRGGGRGSGPQEIGTWLHIGEDSSVTA